MNLSLECRDKFVQNAQKDTSILYIIASAKLLTFVREKLYNYIEKIHVYAMGR